MQRIAKLLHRPCSVYSKRFATYLQPEIDTSQIRIKIHKIRGLTFILILLQLNYIIQKIKLHKLKRQTIVVIFTGRDILKTKLKKDSIFKEFWRDNERFADLFNGAVFGGREIIRAVFENRTYEGVVICVKD